MDQPVYESTVLGRPVATLILTALIILTLGWFAQDFALDASADSLILEYDEDLRYYRYVRARYGSDDYLIVTYTPQDDLFSTDTLADLGMLRDELLALPNVAGITEKS
jgi:predicted RND superfamily exporter protein